MYTDEEEQEHTNEEVEIISLEELDEMMESVDCPNCGAEIQLHDSDEWGLCPDCRADLESHEVENPYKPLHFEE